MKDRRFLWIGLFFIGLALLLLLAIGCIPEKCLIKLGPQVTFSTYEDGRTEILLVGINLSDRYVFGVIADVVIQHIQTEEIIDCKRIPIGDFEPRGMMRFSAWTDRLIFGDDVGIRATFTYEGMK